MGGTATTRLRLGDRVLDDDSNAAAVQGPSWARRRFGNRSVTNLHPPYNPKVLC